MEKGFTFKLWNGQYGAQAKFVVLDNSTGMQSMFTPGRTQDLVWTKADLASDPSLKDWEPFGEETVPNLEDVAF
jgi:hypothetical protein